MKTDATLLVIGYVWPEPNSSAAGKRMMQLLQSFIQANYEIVFASAAQKSGFEANLIALGITEKQIQLNHASFDAFISDLNPTVVLFDRFFMEEQFGWRVSKNCPNALKILDTEDLHFLRHARQIAWKENREVNVQDLQSDFAKREVASILRCDCSLIISEYEMKLLQTSYAISPDILWYYPLFFQKLADSNSPFLERKDFIFIGNFWHEPNWQAVKYLKEQIWPLVSKALPQVSMQIYGAYASEKVLQLHNLKQRFIVNGRAENALQKVSAARVCLAPLSFGAGLKGKLLEAMQVGTPSITTQVGAEGIASTEDWPGFVAQTPENIALAAVQLYSDFETWQSAQNKGFWILENRFKQELYEEDFLEHVVSLRQNLKKHRERNFMGAVLQHQTMASTEYMSRWIEAKTKLS